MAAQLPIFEQLKNNQFSTKEYQRGSFSDQRLNTALLLPNKKLVHDEHLDDINLFLLMMKS